MGMTKKLIGTASAIALAGGLLLAAPTAANAALTCPGTRIATKPINNAAGTRVANIGIYRSGTQYCAVLIKQGPVYGVATNTFLKIERVPYGSAAGGMRQDSGSFKYQTDALKISGSNARLWVWGYTTGRNGKVFQWSGFVKN